MVGYPFLSFAVHETDEIFSSQMTIFQFKEDSNQEVRGSPPSPLYRDPSSGGKIAGYLPPPLKEMERWGNLSLHSPYDS